MAVAFANIFMARIENQILAQSCIKPLFWKWYIDDVFSLWNTSLYKIDSFVEKANNFHSTIKFTAEMPETEVTFLDTEVYKRGRFDKESILDVQTNYKPTETFQCTNFYSCHPPGMNRGFIKGDWALRLLRTNSSQIKFERNIRNFQNRLLERGYSAAILRKYLSEVKFADRKTAPQQRNKSARKKLLPSVTQYHPALPSLKPRTLMGKWHLIQNQLRLRKIFKEPPLISYRMGKSLKDLLVRAKL